MRGDALNQAGTFHNQPSRFTGVAAFVSRERHGSLTVAAQTATAQMAPKIPESSLIPRYLGRHHQLHLSCFDQIDHFINLLCATGFPVAI